jgi:hypothetical protein
VWEAGWSALHGSCILCQYMAGRLSSSQYLWQRLCASRRRVATSWRTRRRASDALCKETRFVKSITLHGSALARQQTTCRGERFGRWGVCLPGWQLDGRRRRTQDVGSMGRLAGALRMRRQANMSDKLDSALHLRIRSLRICLAITIIPAPCRSKTFCPSVGALTPSEHARPLTTPRTHRQVCGFADLGHHERWKR